MDLVIGDDGVLRCSWGAEPEIYQHYHDEEWGRAVIDDSRLFEKICLEGFQAGLSWLTILRKRDSFRAGFAGFEPATVAGFGEEDVERLLADAGIVRHQGKIRSTINNAGHALELIEERGSLAAYFWSWAEPEPPPPVEIPPTTDASTALSKDLKKRGWTFVGPTTVYAFMQAMGLVNDHLDGCHVREECARARRHVMGAGL
ncbi:MAG TPA: DNA-3-methyladenine glycosylase I [Acidimicrobiia bacterium]|jgi:DNA-3-methyladenine glycosylase I|nr:DNA-3-methyladenine glycosylase I [Acidimicrobiia bacterium]